jgi:hypothetical protein
MTFVRLFSRNNFKGASVFLKAALIHDQNMVPGSMQLDPFLVNTSRLVNTYMSSAIDTAFEKVPSLEEFYKDFTSNEWLSTAGTKLLQDGGTQETALEEDPAQGAMTVTVETEPILRVEFTQLETRSRKRSTSETTKASSTRPPSRPVTPKQVTRVILKRESKMASRAWHHPVTVLALIRDLARLR